MEHSKRLVPKMPTSLVLILIVMEDTHGVTELRTLLKAHKRINPYYNGRYSWSVGVLHIHIKNLVLILIIMEDTHGEYVYKPTWPLSTS